MDGAGGGGAEGGGEIVCGEWEASTFLFPLSATGLLSTPSPPPSPCSLIVPRAVVRRGRGRGSIRLARPPNHLIYNFS